MRTVGSIFLTLLFIPVFLTTLLSATIKYQLISTNFWLGAFRENNIYSKVALLLKDTAEYNIVLEGGNVNDAKVLTDLISPSNLEDLVSKNLTNLFDFVNARKSVYYIYIPVSKLSKDLLPANVAIRSDSLPVEELLSELNVKQIGKDQIVLLGTVGTRATNVFAIGSFASLAILVSLFLLTRRGERFWSMGISLVTSGILILGAFGIFEVIRTSMLTDWPKASDTGQKLMSIFLPIIVQKVLIFWLTMGIVLLVLGIALFFLKKGVYNIRK